MRRHNRHTAMHGTTQKCGSTVKSEAGRLHSAKPCGMQPMNFASIKQWSTYTHTHVTLYPYALSLSLSLTHTHTHTHTHNVKVGSAVCLPMLQASPCWAGSMLLRS